MGHSRFSQWIIYVYHSKLYALFSSCTCSSTQFMPCLLHIQVPGHNIGTVCLHRENVLKHNILIVHFIFTYHGTIYIWISSYMYHAQHMPYSLHILYIYLGIIYPLFTLHTYTTRLYTLFLLQIHVPKYNICTVYIIYMYQRSTNALLISYSSNRAQYRQCLHHTNVA